MSLKKIKLFEFELNVHKKAKPKSSFSENEFTHELR